MQHGHPFVEYELDLRSLDKSGNAGAQQKFRFRSWLRNLDYEMLIGRSFDQIDGGTINALVEARANESIYLEFKRATYGNSDSDKREFLKDITCFANTLGGHIIIGVSEENGEANAIEPLVGLDVDRELLRLENIARTGIEPAIVGLRMRRIDVAGGNIVLIHIPRSFNPPHRVISGGVNRYYGRNSAGAHELSLEELRMLFGRQRSIEEQAKAFVGHRFLKIQSNDGAMPIPIADGAIVLHLVPLPDFGAGRRIELDALHGQLEYFRPIGATGWSSRFNLDGLCIYRGGPVCHGYTQVFRDGSIEATSASLVIEREGGRYFPSQAIPQRLIEAVNHYMFGLRAFGATSPILLQISAMGVHGVGLGVDRARFLEQPSRYERETLFLPPSIIPEFRDDRNYESIIADQMHSFWNVFGFARCVYFDDIGRWIVR